MAIYNKDIVKCPDGETEYEITLISVPVDSLWSITVDNANGEVSLQVEIQKLVCSRLSGTRWSELVGYE